MNLFRVEVETTDTRAQGAYRVDVWELDAESDQAAMDYVRTAVLALAGAGRATRVSATCVGEARGGQPRLVETRNVPAPRAG